MPLAYPLVDLLKRHAHRNLRWTGHVHTATPSRERGFARLSTPVSGAKRLAQAKGGYDRYRRPLPVWLGKLIGTLKPGRRGCRDRSQGPKARPENTKVRRQPKR